MRTIAAKRATYLFVLAYVAITALATGLYFVLLAVNRQSINAACSIREDPSYLTAEKLYPLLNLVVWTCASWLYFRKETASERLLRPAVYLGLFWLLIAIPLDFIGFVLIKNPLSLGAHDFYIGQFPWIYLIYVAVFISPLCWVGLAKLAARQK